MIKDGEGNYFLVPCDTLERGRVPAEQTTEIERLIAESANAQPGVQDDVQGHVLLPAMGLVALGLIGFDLGASGFGGGVIEGAVRQAQAATAPKGGGRPPA